jgi:uncharacterized protein with HEPN domain
MNDDVKKFRVDIIESVNSIDQYIGANKNFAHYSENKMLKRAVEREMEIIGEAVGRILKINPEITITSSRKVIDLRNKVIHAYDAVDDTIMWGIIIRHLPVLKTEVENLLKS